MARKPVTPATELSKSQQAYHWIKERISSHEFAPGYRLALTVIAGELDVSVVPVREAIRQLEAEGLVTYERNVGAHVAMFDDSEYRYSMQTLGIVEGAATALSARRLTARDLKDARAVNQRLKRSLKPFDPHAFTGLNRQFHAILYGRCPNPRLLDVVSTEWARLGNLRDSTFSFVPGRAHQSVQEHDAIVDLIETGAPPAQIEAAARQHRQATLDAYLSHEHPHDVSDPEELFR